MIPSRPVFTLTLTVPTIEDIGNTPYGARKIATVTGGTFEGDRLRGTVLPSPAGDWLLLRSDGVLCLDVRMTLKTDDGALIFLHYNGMRHGPEEVLARLGQGEAVDPATYYMRAMPIFETSSAKYSWLNRAVFVAMGRRVAAGPIYEVHEVL